MSTKKSTVTLEAVQILKAHCFQAVFIGGSDWWLILFRGNLTWGDGYKHADNSIVNHPKGECYHPKGECYHPKGEMSPNISGT